MVMAQSDQTWYAVLDAGGQQLPLNLEFSDSSGSLQSPKQTDQRIPLSSVRLTADSLQFTVDALQLRYRGALHPDSIVGVFQQATFATELIFYPAPPAGYDAGPPAAASVRPQDPTDSPYERRSASFPGGAEGVTLTGELTLPSDTLPKALLVLVSGSGPQNRDGELGPPINHRTLLVLGDYLTRHGYGVLRYDERGVAESTGDFGTATTADFAQDAQAAVRYVRQDERFADIPVGIAGHSEGGLIAPMVAAEGVLDFAVLLAAPGIPTDSLLLDQRRAISGMTAPDEPVLRAVYSYTKEHYREDEQAFRDGLRAVILSVIPSLDSATRRSIVDPADYADTYANLMTPPWMRYFLTVDPADYLQRMTVPVLAINGMLDQQVTIGNLTAVGAALERARNADITLVEVPGVNHLLQPAETGAPGEYGEIEMTISPTVLETIVAWLDERY
ncbi:hypothetical protein LEM8419_00618 [Neolewinella maritima]|uniref:Serine aminopeptidase S33 domain-containing protein n=2 Tax=Neolewinella maritima TaxID=1383882 RepID=A0ABN8F0D0_9BACT|nr:hypothetical protein LEM8419_00618 [Neolewinella maritima]